MQLSPFSSYTMFTMATIMLEWAEEVYHKEFAIEFLHFASMNEPIPRALSCFYYQSCVLKSAAPSRGKATKTPK
jgi:hypothetical protein